MSDQEIRETIVLQFANQILMARPPIAAARMIGPAEISDAATAEFHACVNVARDAVALWRRQTAPPAVATQVVREVNGREQEVKIVAARPRHSIEEAEIYQMAVEIQQQVHRASAAAAKADDTCLRALQKAVATISF